MQPRRFPGLTTASLTLALCLATAPASRGADLGASLPGDLDVGGLVALRRLLTDFPALGRAGMLAEKLDEIHAQGFPDPRSELESLALGARLGGPKGVREGMTLARSDEPLLPLVRKLADVKGVSLEERAERGVRFLRGTFRGQPSEFADLADGLVYGAVDSQGSHDLGRQLLGTLGGERPSFAARFSRDLDAGTYLTLRAVLDKSVRKALGSTKLAHLANLEGASADLTRRGDMVRLEVRADVDGKLKAMGASALLGNKLGKLREQASDPAARRFLEALKLDRDGSTLVLTSETSAADFEQGVLALMGLGEAKAREKMAARAAD